MKVRNAERDLGRFKSSWFVKDKQDDIPEEEQLTNGNFFQYYFLKGLTTICIGSGSHNFKCNLGFISTRKFF